MLSHQNKLNLSLPYFTSKEDRTLYVIIPMKNAMMLKKPPKDAASLSTEEEILPDFRCKVCFATFSTFSEFKIHRLNHEKDEDALKGSNFLGINRTQQVTDSDYLKNFQNKLLFNASEHNSLISASIITRRMHNKIFPSKIVSNLMPKPHLRFTSPSKNISSSNNTVYFLNNMEKSAHFKLQNLKMKNVALQKEVNESLSLNLSFTKQVDKCDKYIKTSDFSNHTGAYLSNVNDDFDKPLLNDKNILVSNRLHSSVISHEIIQQNADNISAAEFSAFNVTPAPGYIGFKKLLTPEKKKKIPFGMKHNLVSSHQSQSTTQTVDSKSEVITRNVSETRDNKVINELNSFLSMHDSLVNASNSFKNDTYMEDHSRDEKFESDESISMMKPNNNEAMKYNVSCPSTKTSDLQSIEINDRGVYILEPSTNANQKPLRCIYCRKAYTSCAQMRKHLLLHEESKSMFCAMCNLSFARISTFRSHLLVFHCQLKYGKKCPFCDYKCFRFSNLENHLLKNHPGKFQVQM